MRSGAQGKHESAHMHIESLMEEVACRRERSAPAHNQAERCCRHQVGASFESNFALQSACFSYQLAALGISTNLDFYVVALSFVSCSYAIMV